MCGAQVVEYVAVCGVLHCHGSNARALGLGDVVRSLAMGPLRALNRVAVLKITGSAWRDKILAETI